MAPREADGPSTCLAVDVVRSGLDPLTGRTWVANHVPIAAWAGHLCDLLLSGAIRDVDGVATVDTGTWSQRRTVRGRRWAETPAAARPTGSGPGSRGHTY